MNKLHYAIALIVSKITRKGNEYIVNKLRSSGIKIGKNTHFFQILLLPNHI